MKTTMQLAGDPFEIEMELDDVRKWVKALESGEYRQDTDALVNPDGNAFCCLGVRQHVNGKPMMYAFVGLSFDVRGEFENANDKARWTFPQIAQALRDGFGIEGEV
jgi:hypothetical protein